MSGLDVDKLREIKDKASVSNDEQYDYFIESGTCCGVTTLKVYNIFKEVHTIELLEELYNRFDNTIKSNGDKYKNIISYHGDSYKVFPKVFEKLDKVGGCVFWLDGHYSGNGTAQGDKDCPLLEECECIDNEFPCDYALILIDDVRLFGTNQHEDWIDIDKEKIKNKFKNFKIENEFYYGDIMVLKIRR